MFLLKLFCFSLLTAITISEERNLFGILSLLLKPNPNGRPPRTSPKTVDQTCACGQSPATKGPDDNKIINGQEVKPKYKYPWMAALKSFGTFFCGGALINSRFVLTAAHCVALRLPSDLEVVLGIHDITKAKSSFPTDLAGEPHAIKRTIVKIKRHGSYNPGRQNSAFDIALLKMAQEVIFTPQIMPLCLPKQASSHTLPKLKTTIAGWGRTETGKTSDVLKEAEVDAYSAQLCHSSVYGGLISNEMMCAAAPGKDTCDGDSGGPLFYKSATSNTILGIASWGSGCAVANYPGVFTRVSEFVNWIYTKTRAGKYCKNPDNGQ